MTCLLHFVTGSHCRNPTRNSVRRETTGRQQGKTHPCDVLTLGYYKCEYFCSSLILCCLWELKPQNILWLTVTCFNDRCFFHHQGDGGMVSMTAECAASLYGYLYHSFLDRCLLLILSWFNSLHQLQTCVIIFLYCVLNDLWLIMVKLNRVLIINRSF